MKHNLQLRSLSKSDKRDIEEISNRSQSRKNRLLSSSSSKGRINLEEFTRLKLENEKYKAALTEMVQKFMKFKTQMASQAQNINSSESGSSIVWKDRAQKAEEKYGVNSKTDADADMVKVEVDDDKDQRIKSLQQQLQQKDKVIAKLKRELDAQRKANQASK